MWYSIRSGFGHTRTLLTLLLLASALLNTACSSKIESSSPDVGIKPGVSYSATIERTRYGTAHVTADSWGSLGFGQGYAFAQDRFCVLADQILKVRSQRSRYFGPGDEWQHIETDFAYLGLGVVEKAASMVAALSETWRPLAFSRAQIEADPALTSMTVGN